MPYLGKWIDPTMASHSSQLLERNGIMGVPQFNPGYLFRSFIYFSFLGNPQVVKNSERSDASSA